MLLSFADSDADMLETHSMKQFVHLGFGLLAGFVQVIPVDNALTHDTTGFEVEALAVGSCPGAGLIEGLGAGLIDKLIAQQADGRQVGTDCIALKPNPSLTGLTQIDTHTEGTILDAYQFGIAKESM